MIETFLKIYFLFLFFITHALLGQSSDDLKLQDPKRFIDKVEIFAGPSLSFNHGNKFIENYNDENVTNKRLVKVGYAFGIGAYHPISDRFDMNIRLQYERKGTRTELNTPWLPDNNRLITYDLYHYQYLTIIAAPQVNLGPKKNLGISLGFYYSKIKTVKGYGETYDTDGTIKSEGSYEGRYFYDLNNDGRRRGFTWMPYLTGIEDNDFGVVLSLGYSVPLSNKHKLVFQLQDNYGLKDINKDNPYGLEEKNHSVSFIINYNFQLPPKK